LFEYGGRGIADAGIDVAECLQPEQRGGVVGVVEYEGRGLIDRRHPCAGGGIGLRTGMHGKGRKSRETVGHSMRPVVLACLKARHADRSRVRRQVGRGTKTGVLLYATLSKRLFHIQVTWIRFCSSQRDPMPRSRRRRRSFDSATVACPEQGSARASNSACAN